MSLQESVRSTAMAAAAVASAVPPATSLVCRECGGVRYRTRVEKLGKPLQLIGHGLLATGYALVAIVLFNWGLYVVLSLVHGADATLPAWASGGASHAELLGLLAWVVAGHLLAQTRCVWMCSVCGSVMERSDRPERIWERQQAAAKKKAQSRA